LRWWTFLRLHAQEIIACDFLVAVTATFRLLYVFVVIEHHSRRLIHCNVTAHPSAAWTLQQPREAVGFEERYEYLLHDRESIFAKHLDEILERLSSNSEAYDKAILTLASALLALSVTFIKDLLPSSPINHVWLLYGSWIVLTAAIIGTVLSFRISDAALAKQLDQIDRYYAHKDDTALARTGLASLIRLGRSTLSCRQMPKPRLGADE
jgi:hypothetical protein